MKTIKKVFTALFLSLTVFTVFGQSKESLHFKPLHLVISVSDVQESASWYISTLDFEPYQSFEVPEKGLAAQLLKKGDFELMLMKSVNAEQLPEYRKNTFTDLNVEGVKRIAFEVDNLDLFISTLTSKKVKIDVSPRLFDDKKNGVSFRWAIIKDNNGNLLEFVERTKTNYSITEFLERWGNAWSPKENAANFNKAVLREVYIQSENLVAFDFTDANKKTVIKGAENHHNFWEPFIRQFKYWKFTPDFKSLKIHALNENSASISLYVDNFGKLPDGSEFKGNAHVTLILLRENDKWKIIHENIWGPVNE